MAEVIVALDHPRADEALALVEILPGLRWVKIASTLFLSAGPSLLAALQQRGLRVFLDLKWHDIPHQVAGAVRGAADLGVDLVTVHALGGPHMLVAAQEAAGGRVRVAAVSVLTSHDEAEWGTIVGRPAAPVDEVARLVRVAAGAGITAMVGAPGEAATIRAGLGPDAWVITPGIRPSGMGQDDQRRVAGPAEAVAAGATHLVVGRPITGAANPAAVYEEICRHAG